MLYLRHAVVNRFCGSLVVACSLAAILLLGCGSESAPEGETGAADSPTFARDIAPIIYENCSGCHRPGEAGPFPLLTYDDVRRRALLIQTVTETGYMPPWLPEPGAGDFEEERRRNHCESFPMLARCRTEADPSLHAPNRSSNRRR